MSSFSPNFKSYNVLTDGKGKYAAGLRLGVVSLKTDGWRFIPSFQASPSRRGWPAPEAALEGRVTHFKLEGIPGTELTHQLSGE